MTVKRRCEGCVSVEAFEIFGQGEDLESCGYFSWEDLLEDFGKWCDGELVSRARVRVVPDLTDVPVSPSSVVTELCDVSYYSDREFVEPQSYSFSPKRAHCCTDTQEEMRYEGSLLVQCQTMVTIPQSLKENGSINGTWIGPKLLDVERVEETDYMRKHDVFEVVDYDNGFNPLTLKVDGRDEW